MLDEVDVQPAVRGPEHAFQPPRRQGAPGPQGRRARGRILPPGQRHQPRGPGVGRAGMELPGRGLHEDARGAPLPAGRPGLGRNLRPQRLEPPDARLGLQPQDAGKRPQVVGKPVPPGRVEHLHPHAGAGEHSRQVGVHPLHLSAQEHHVGLRRQDGLRPRLGREAGQVREQVGVVVLGDPDQELPAPQGGHVVRVAGIERDHAQRRGEGRRDTGAEQKSHQQEQSHLF